MTIGDPFRAKHEHNDPEVRRKAVADLEDQSLLADIAWDDPDSHIRQTAVQRLTDAALLADIAKI